jgi:NADPH:quinone reductase-like Zn-dependent oxidoreductase
VSGVDVVLESIGGDYAERSLKTLRPGGHLITIVERTNETLARRTRQAGFRFSGVTVEPDHQGLEELGRLVEAGRSEDSGRAGLPAREGTRGARAARVAPEGKARADTLILP